MICASLHPFSSRDAPSTTLTGREAYIVEVTQSVSPTWRINIAPSLEDAWQYIRAVMKSPPLLGN